MNRQEERVRVGEREEERRREERERAMASVLRSENNNGFYLYEDKRKEVRPVRVFSEFKISSILNF